MSKKKVLISGGGPAGLASAILLDMNTYEVTIVERGPRFMDMGFSIILWKAGREILSEILGSKDLKDVHPLNSFNIYGGSNIKLLESADSTGIGFSIERDSLVNQLSETFLEACGRDAVKFNTSIHEIIKNDENLSVSFSDGKTAMYDLLIVAEGMHSYTRSGNFTSLLESKAYKICYSWIKPGSKLHNEAIIGFLQSHVFLIQTVGDKALLAYYHSQGQEESNDFVKNLKLHFENERGGKFETEEQTSENFLSEEVHVQKAYNNRVVLVGDAFHGHSPTLGMGTSMALEDARCVVNLLNQKDVQNLEDLKEVFEAYEKDRKARIRQVYSLQDFIESLILTDSNEKVLLAESILKFGGWKILEPLLKNVFKG